MKEEDIRKRESLDKYLELIRQDVEDIFVDKSSFVRVRCPACSEEDYTIEFEKIGFKYVSCKTCDTLYANPRPTYDQLKWFYNQSKSTTYWINDFFKPVAEARRKNIFRPRAEYIVEKFGKKNHWLIGDVGAGFGLFLQELKALWPNNRYLAIELSEEQSEICRQGGLDVLCTPLEEVQGYDEQFDLLTAFELLEHLHEPSLFLNSIYRILKPGGLIQMTTLNAHGFDIQILWEKSKSVFPPHHLNFFNTDSICRLLDSCGFAVIELDTPGKLDLDIVAGAVKEEGVDVGRFVRMVVERASLSAKNELQAWIRGHQLSSHMRVLAKKQ